MQLNTALNEEPRRFDRWLQGHKLSFNVADTRSMLINTKQRRSISRLQIKPYNLLFVRKYGSFMQF